MSEIACGATTPDSASQPKPQFDAPEQVLDGADAHTATLTTSCGAVSLRLLTAEAPLTANNFAFLASQGFYDGTIVHRIVPGFVVQMGDPKGDGTGGPGYRFADELDAAQRRGYTRGTVAMANAGPDTNGSQFFVCLDEVGLPPAYSVFGEVVDGMDTIDRIASLPVDGEAPQQLCYVEAARVDL